MQEQQNPYSTPEAIVADIELELRLGGRGERLVAAIMDTLILMAVMLPAMYFSGYFTAILSGSEQSMLMQLGWTLGAFVIFVLIQGCSRGRGRPGARSCSSSGSSTCPATSRTCSV